MQVFLSGETSLYLKVQDAISIRVEFVEEGRGFAHVKEPVGVGGHGTAATIRRRASRRRLVPVLKLFKRQGAVAIGVSLLEALLRRRLSHLGWSHAVGLEGRRVRQSFED